MKLTENFDSREFTCPDCGITMIAYKLINGLQELRDSIIQPVIITSGFRCEEHNEKIGGVKNSRHTYGDAADIKVKGMPGSKLALIAGQIAAFEEGGIGVYPNYIHVDTRGVRARWEKV